MMYFRANCKLSTWHPIGSPRPIMPVAGCSRMFYDLPGGYVVAYMASLPRRSGWVHAQPRNPAQFRPINYLSPTMQIVQPHHATKAASS